MTKEKLPGKLSLYDFHGVTIEPDDRTTKADCPFCGREGHFYIDTETGQWQCKKGCGDGNIFTFLNKLHETASDPDTLAEEYKLPLDAMVAWRIVQHPIIAGEYLIPAYNAKGNLANLYKLVQIAQPHKDSQASGSHVRWRALSSPGLNVHPFGQHLLPSEFETLNVFESWSDAVTFWQAHADKDELAILATPGAGALKQLSPYLDGSFRQPPKPLKHIRWYGDNDEPGYKGLQQLTNKLIPSLKAGPKKVSAVHWSLLDPKTLKPVDPTPDNANPINADLPEGYDVRKLLQKMPKSGLRTLKALLRSVDVTSPKDAPQPAIDPLPCSSFDDLLQYWDQTRGGALLMTQQLKDTLAIVLATVISTPLGGDDQLWFRIIGPPGSAKSTIAEAISAAKPYVWAKSMFTGLHSGYTGGGSNTDEDASLVPQIKGKTICNKDADSLYQQSGFNRVMGELRDIYDKTSRFVYRNKKGADHEDFACTFVLCGTDELRAASAHSHLGERFLDCEIGSDDDIDAVMNVAQDNEYSQLVNSIKLPNGDGEPPPSKLLSIKQRTYGFIDHYRQRANLHAPLLPPAAKAKIQLYAKLLAHLRAKVRRSGEDLEYRPRTERPHRLVKQLTRLAFCLAIVLQKQEIDHEIMRLVRKVVHDTAHGFQYDLFTLLAAHPNGLSAMQLARRATLPETSIRRLLENMQALGIVCRRQHANNSGQRGRDVHLWTLTPTLADLYGDVYTCPHDSKSIRSRRVAPNRNTNALHSHRTKTTYRVPSETADGKPTKIGRSGHSLPRKGKRPRARK